MSITRWHVLGVLVVCLLLALVVSAIIAFAQLDALHVFQVVGPDIMSRHP